LVDTNARPARLKRVVDEVLREKYVIGACLEKHLLDFCTVAKMFLSINRIFNYETSK
jgi:hypothetical protein